MTSLSLLKRCMGSVRYLPTSTPNVKLQSCSCALGEVPATAAREVCPDCPRAHNVNAPDVKEAATLSLRRFNEESLLTNYFTPENITRASSQLWWLLLVYTTLVPHKLPSVAESFLAPNQMPPQVVTPGASVRDRTLNSLRSASLSEGQLISESETCEICVRSTNHRLQLWRSRPAGTRAPATP